MTDQTQASKTETSHEINSQTGALIVSADHKRALASSQGRTPTISGAKEALVEDFEFDPLINSNKSYGL